VRYVLKGSVRKAGNRVRITGQLIDAADGAHLWADSASATTVRQVGIPIRRAKATPLLFLELNRRPEVVRVCRIGGESLVAGGEAAQLIR
jgi:hypothetical protein